MPTLIFSRVGDCPPCSPRASAHALSHNLGVYVDLSTLYHRLFATKMQRCLYVDYLIILSNNVKVPKPGCLAVIMPPAAPNRRGHQAMLLCDV